jgi:hypothetical protein
MDRRNVVDYPSTHHDGDPDRHVFTGMNGLVLGITVDGKPAAASAWRPAKRLRLFVQSDSTPGDRDRRFGYVLQRGAEPKPDSLEYPGPVLVLTRGEPTSIEVVNRSGEPTAVHWHGIELESYYDGVAGWSGLPGKTAPAIRPGQGFEVRITPKRAGTFMYHTHLDDLRQQYGGLIGPLVVLDPGEKWDPTHDLVIMLSDGVPWRTYINGSLTPAPKELEVGKTYRLRIADIAVFRQFLSVRLVRDSTVLTWRPVAKDGFTIAAAQATMRPSVVNLPSGETADFEFTPDQPGEVTLEVLGQPGSNRDGPQRGPPSLHGRLLFHVSPAAQACDRQCLTRLVDRYLSALIARDPARLAVAPDVRFTENGHDLRLGEGLWQSTLRPGSYRVYIVDPDNGAAAAQTVLYRGTDTLQVLVRLAVRDTLIHEIETLIARRGDTCCWSPTSLDSLSSAFSEDLPSGALVSRAELLAIVEGYFTALHTGGTADYRPAKVDDQTTRWENGQRTTNVPGRSPIVNATAPVQMDRGMFAPLQVVNRRYLAVDPQKGTALAIVLFNQPNRPRPTTIIAEFFKIASGTIREIRAVMVGTDPTGWR